MEESITWTGCEGRKLRRARRLLKVLSRWNSPSTHSRTQGLCKSHRNLFSRPSFCPDGIPGLFLRTGPVIGLSGLFRPLRFSVRQACKIVSLEIVGLDSRTGLIIGDFAGSLGHEGRG